MKRTRSKPIRIPAIVNAHAYAEDVLATRGKGKGWTVTVAFLPAAVIVAVWQR